MKERRIKAKDLKLPRYFYRNCRLKSDHGYHFYEIDIYRQSEYGGGRFGMQDRILTFRWQCNNDENVFHAYAWGIEMQLDYYYADEAIKIVAAVKKMVGRGRVKDVFRALKRLHIVQKIYSKDADGFVPMKYRRNGAAYKAAVNLVEAA